MHLIQIAEHIARIEALLGQSATWNKGISQLQWLRRCLAEEVALYEKHCAEAEAAREWEHMHLACHTPMSGAEIWPA